MGRRGGGPAALLVVIGLLAGPFAGLAPSSAAAAPSWSIIPTSNTRTCQNCSYAIYGVSCPSATVCMATGLDTRRFVRKPNSAKWSAQLTPSAPNTVLSQVSCPTTTFCMALSSATRVERWNGTGWKVVPTPLPHKGDYGSLWGVSCTSASFCMAVGNYASNAAKLLVMRWDGKTWSFVGAPLPPGGRTGTSSAWTGELNAVSCTTTTNCIAVGQTARNDAPLAVKTLMERWNGVRWSVVPSPSPAGAWPRLVSVSCTSTSNCMAVGYATSNVPFSKSYTFTERWNGARWAIVASPSTAAPENLLFGVSCADATNCMGVGLANYSDVNTGQYLTKTLTQRWNGTRWEIVASPNPNPSSENLITYSSLAAVSCTSPTACMAVGSAPGNNHNGYLSLAEQYR